MYIAPFFKPASIDVIQPFIERYSFATLVSLDGKLPIATHIPLLLEQTSQQEVFLKGHIARANPQWKSIEGQTVLAIFNEPHAYVSSSWYGHINVPTWNYIAVHVYGEVQIIDGQSLEDHLRNMVQKYEQGRPKAFDVDQLTPRSLKAQMRGIVGLSIKVTDIQATFKLSQNRNDEDFNTIISHLQNQDDPLAKAIAQEMRKLQ